MAMLTDRKAVVVFPDDFDEQSAFEMPSRGYLSHSLVQLVDGTRYPVFFIDPVRLSQELEILGQSGQAYLAEVNMIVLPDVTVDAIQNVVDELAEQGFFQHLKPLS